MSSHQDLMNALSSFIRDTAAGTVPDSEQQTLVAAVDAHLGEDSRALSGVSERINPARFIDLNNALESLATSDGVSQSEFLGIGGTLEPASLRELLRGEDDSRPAVRGPLEYVVLANGPRSTQQVVRVGVRLLKIDGVPLVVFQRDAQPDWGRQHACVELLCSDPATSEKFWEQLRTLMRENSVLKGQLISFDFDDYEATLGGVQFHERPAIDASEVILPEGRLDRLVRHVVTLGEHRDALLAAGQHLKRGVLLYGPPGTGKTHTIRHLLGQLPDTTGIMLSGNALGQVRDAVKLARALDPSVVVLEDCDLIAEDRDLIPESDSALFEFLDALDGLDGDADVTFLMTTNRPELLERALAQRPGRVDLAVEIPRPDEAGRRALLTLYTDGLDFSETAIAQVVAESEGVTASFIKELARRAVLRAAIAGRSPNDEDLTTSLTELLTDQATFADSLLDTLEDFDD